MPKSHPFHDVQRNYAKADRKKAFAASMSRVALNLGAVEHSAAAFIALLATGPTPEPPVVGCSGRSETVAALHATHRMFRSSPGARSSIDRSPYAHPLWRHG